jgi:uncharacterized protein
MHVNVFERLRALGWVFIAIVYFLFAERLAGGAASGLASGAWLDFFFRCFLLLLLLAGFAAMGYAAQRQQNPLKTMGLERRPGWRREFALGAAIGWGGIVACVLPVALTGGLYLAWHGSLHSIGMLVLDTLTLAVAALIEEVAFRGYPFQRLIEAVGPTTAVLLASLAFGVLHLQNPDATAGSTLVTILAGMLLALAYLRTRALWVSWGLHFGWNASMGLLFGLPISGLTMYSPVIRTRTYGPFWLTGGGYGPEGSAVAVVVLLALIVVMMRATGDLKHQYAQPVIVAGGIPVDIDAIARKQHEAAMGAAAPAQPKLVQIGGIASPAPAPPIRAAGEILPPESNGWERVEPVNPDEEETAKPE